MPKDTHIMIFASQITVLVALRNDILTHSEIRCPVVIIL